MEKRLKEMQGGITVENEPYKKLYYHAFNRLTDLTKEIQLLQSELEELYLKLTEETEGAP